MKVYLLLPPTRRKPREAQAASGRNSRTIACLSQTKKVEKKKPRDARLNGHAKGAPDGTRQGECIAAQTKSPLSKWRPGGEEKKESPKKKKRKKKGKNQLRETGEIGLREGRGLVPSLK